MTVLPTSSSSSSPALTATSHSNSNGVNGINGTLKPHSEHSFATRSIHVGSEPHLSSSSGVSTPLDLSTTYAQSSVGIHKGFEYSRSSNPTRLALERLIASLEGADQGLKRELRDGADEWVRENGPAALAFASGSAATATVVQALVGNKGHIVSVGDVYGGTSRYMLKVAGPLQDAETTFVDLSYRAVDGEVESDSGSEDSKKERQDQAILQRLEEAVRPETKVIWIETPTNPMLNLIPIRLISTFAISRSIYLVVDNTFASPYLQLPLSLGASVVLGSSTKYLSGHSDVIGGYVASSSPTILMKLRFLQNAHGAVPSPFDAYLLIRSFKTLSLRVRQHSLNGLAIATYLDREATRAGLVRDVRYPGLRRSRETPAQSRERELAWEQITPDFRRWVEKQGYTKESEGGFPCGGMVTFHIRSEFEGSQERSETAEKFLQGLKVFTLAESLGGVESLAELPVKMTHGGVSPAHRVTLGIDGELIRLSVGVEDVEDLVEDVKRALEGAVQVA
ncbi:hypothetical protein JCM11641_006934 [Rhodosporidiobolus odoratus]